MPPFYVTAQFLNQLARAQQELRRADFDRHFGTAKGLELYTNFVVANNIVVFSSSLEPADQLSFSSLISTYKSQ